VFIRTKTVKGSTYFQVVRADRDGDRVRQTVLASLGQNPTVEAAIKAERRSLARLRRERGLWPGTVESATHGKTLAARLARLDARIARSAGRIDHLTGLQRTMRSDASNKARRSNEKTKEA
jgi:hypothetical protein